MKKSLLSALGLALALAFTMPILGATSAVMPPAAAARVAVSNPSHSVRPGSLTWTCVSTIPGEITRSGTLNTLAPVGSSPSNATMRSMTPPSMCNAAERTPSGRTMRWLRTRSPAR